MAKLTGPLLSESAHGTVGGVLTFSKRTSGNQVRYQRAQMDYENEPRAEQRARFWAAMQWWSTLSSDEKDEWETLGRQA